MNKNDSARLHEMLSRATAPADEASDVSDAEAESLRRGWLGLCRLIEEDQRTAGEAERNDIEPIQYARRRCRTGAPRQPAAWSPWLISAVAASVLIAATMTMIARRFGGGVDVQPQPQQLAHDDTSSDNHSAGSLLAHVAPSPQTSVESQRHAAADRWQWGDTVDDDITAVSQGTLLAQQDWYAQSSRIGAVQSGLDELENEMEQGKP
jgi:hypothetical protein